MPLPASTERASYSVPGAANAPRWRPGLCVLIVTCLSISGTLNASAAESAPEPAGIVELVEGTVQVTDKMHHAHAIQVDNAIMEGDTIITGADGEVHLAMADGGVLAVRPNTRLTLTRYRAQGDASDSSLLDLAAGAVRSITGWIGRFNRSQYAIRTPTATIGVRGTDHEPMVIVPGEGVDEPGTYEKVNAGSTYLETQHGRVDVPAGRAAFSPQSRKRGLTRPRLLDRIPGFYRPARHEDRLERLHERVQEKLQHLREERIRELKARPAQARAEQRGRNDADRRERANQRAKASADARRARAESRHGSAKADEPDRQSGHANRRDDEHLRKDRADERKGHRKPHEKDQE